MTKTFFLFMISVYCTTQIKAQVFQTSSSFSVARYAHCTEQAPNNNVLIFGGVDNGGSSINSVYEYNSSNNTWSAKTSIPSANGLGLSASVKLIDGSIILFGGSQTGSPPQSKKLYKYNYSTDSWTILNDLPNGVGRQEMTATLIDDTTVLLCGGLTTIGSNLQYQSECYLYHTQRDSFSTAGNLAFGVIDHTATLLQNGEVLISGGFDGNTSRSEVYVYNRQNGFRTLTTSLSNAVSAHKALRLNGKVYLYGGFSITNFEYSDKLDVYDPATDEVMPLANGPVATSNFSMIAFDSLILIAGGNIILPSGNYGVTNETNIFNTLTNGFGSFDSLPTIRSNMKISPIGNTGKFLLSGGAVTLTQCYDNAIIFDSEQVFTGLTKILPAHDVNIYPNPVNDYLTIDGLNENANISIYDLTSKLKYNNKLNDNQINVTNFHSGVYLMKIETAKGIRTKKFVKR